MRDKDGPRVNYVFGPVPSRRLGQSLGIDPIPLKTCNWNCVYCQLGRTRPVTNKRREYLPVREILLEVEQALGSRENGTIDWVTFVGSGETTLHCRLGEMIRAVKTMTALPVAVITNGSMLYLSEVRAELMKADAILPTLDAGSIELYRQINRPHPDVTFEHLVNGLTAIRAEYPGKLWIEVMLVLGLNDSPQALEGIAKILGKIRPDAIHINLPTRPPAETWVQPTDEAGLMRALSILGDVAEIMPPTQGSFDLSGYENVVDAVVGIITRHPMRQDELEQTLDRWSPNQVSETLASLETSGRAQVVERYGIRFWSGVPAHFPNNDQSQRTAPNHKKSLHSRYP